MKTSPRNRGTVLSPTTAARRGRRLQCLCLGLLLHLPSAASAVLFYSTGDPTHNTTPPIGALTGSGWQYQGTWGSFLGTPIAPQYFLTAGHVGGTVGAVFSFRGTDYITTATYDDPASDLRLWRICGTFPDYAPLYTGNAEAGSPVVVFGRGTGRGAEVISNGLFPTIKGWRWGAGDGWLRWGTNLITSIVDGDAGVPPFEESSGGLGELLVSEFNANGGSDEAHLSTGDSGGGLFIKDGAVWKLAGINYAVDGPYNTNATGAGFSAAIFDEGGLYQRTDGVWTPSPDLPGDVPGAFYATRVSQHIAWINSVAESPTNSTKPALLVAESVVGPYEPLSEAVVDPRARTISVPKTSNPRFYRLQSCAPTRITSIVLTEESLVISYD